MGRKICPRCESEDIMMVTGGLTGAWACKKCGYENNIFPEITEDEKPKGKKK